jgi:hypothetical protein
MLTRICRVGKQLGELSEPEGCENRDDVGIMREVEIQALVKRKGLDVAVQGGIDL